MRRLILYRHAKSDWPSGVKDHDRPLAPRGLKAAPLMGHYLAAEQLIPDLALVSSARRAQQTWNLSAPLFDEKIPQRDEAKIYLATASALLKLVQATEPSVRTLVMVGHNPGFEELAALLVGHGDRYAFARLREKFPTAAVAVIDFAVEDWSEVAAHDGRLDRFVTPKMLDGEEDE